MAFKSRDLMMKLSAADGQGEGEGTCTKCTATHGDRDDCTKCTATHVHDRDDCTKCTATHPAGPDKRHALADPALGMLRQQLRQVLGGEAR
jgi:hypothetical protein